MNASAILKSMRLRTLPLSLAGSVMGVFAAASVTQISFWPVFTVLLTTAVSETCSCSSFSGWFHAAELAMYAGTTRGGGFSSGRLFFLHAQSDVSAWAC